MRSVTQQGDAVETPAREWIAVCLRIFPNGRSRRDKIGGPNPIEIPGLEVRKETVFDRNPIPALTAIIDRLSPKRANQLINDFPRFVAAALIG